MTNKQWLIEQMQNMSDEELNNFLDGSTGLCYIINPDDDGCPEDDCSKCRINWLKSEHKEKPKLSDAERVILKNVSKEYRWISRDVHGRFYIYTNKPKKLEYRWDCEGNCVHFIAFNHLFQFIKWEDKEAYNIEELLKNENRN